MADRPITSIKTRLQEAMKVRGMKAVQLSQKTGISKSALSHYINGRVSPKQDRIYLLSEALRVDPARLMGYDVPMEKQEKQAVTPVGLPFNVFNPEMKQVPLLGSIACGVPVFALEEHGNMALVSRDLPADFCLEARGDSMVNAKIHDGDLVFCQECSSVDNGAIAAVIIDDEATLKRVFYYPEKELVILRAENPDYSDLVYTGPELANVRVIGRAIACQTLL